MNNNIKLYIAGHMGLVESAIKREFERKGYTKHTQLNNNNNIFIL